MGETIPLVVFGIAKVQEVKILAVLSGLKLEASLRNVHASGTYREKVKGQWSTAHGFFQGDNFTCCLRIQWVICTSK